MKMTDELIARDRTIFLNNEDDHIKLIQHDEINGLIYIRSVNGEEMLVPSKVLCKLIRKFADMNNWK